MESINQVRLTCGYKVGQRIQISLLRLTLHQLALLKHITLVTTTQGHNYLDYLGKNLRQYNAQSLFHS